MTAKKYIALFIIMGWVSSAPLLAQSESGGSLDKPALKLDIPLFDLPYQLFAANVFEYGFFESYTHPSMDQALNITNSQFSAFHFGMKQLGDTLGLDRVWKKLLFYGGTGLGDFLIYLLPFPTGYFWMHESFHVAGFTYTGMRSRLNYDFPNGAYAISDSNYYEHAHDLIRTIAAGMESEYLLVEKMQRNNFFYEQDLLHEFTYWIADLQAFLYAYMSFDSQNPTMTVDGKEEVVSADSLAWAYYLFHPEGKADSDEAIGLSDLTGDEQEFLKTRVLLSLTNFVSPMMLGIRSIRLGKDSGWSGNFALRHWYTSFGTDTALNVYLKKGALNMAFGLHNYLNRDQYFPAIEAELVDFPLRAGRLGVYLSPRVLIGLQPGEHRFSSADPAFMGMLGLRADFVAGKHMLPYVDIMVKTGGWVAGNELLQPGASIKLGVSLRF
jgi:hypothetical protein